MSDSPVPSIKLFDLAAILAGRSYPEVEVPFYLDESAALKLSRRERLFSRYELLGKEDEAKALDAEIEELKKAILDSRYVYHLRGISNKARQDLWKKACEKFPRERDILGGEIENDDRDELYTTLLWHAMTDRIEAPDGAIQARLSLDDVRQFRELLPLPAVAVIQGGVNELSTGAKAGFESAVQDSDFLSQP